MGAGGVVLDCVPVLDVVVVLLDMSSLPEWKNGWVSHSRFLQTLDQIQTPSARMFSKNQLFARLCNLPKFRIPPWETVCVLVAGAMQVIRAGLFAKRQLRYTSVHSG